MNIPELTAKIVNEVLNDEVTLGQVIHARHNIHNKITFDIQNGMYIVYENGENVYTNSYQTNALCYYNLMNDKVDHLF